MRWLWLLRDAAVSAFLCTASVAAQGHGPIYGLSTPTLGRGGWSLDVGAMSRIMDGTGTLMVRPMLSYGLTQDLQASISIPLPLYSSGVVPPVRGWTRMPAVRDVEVMLGWRFHRNAVGVGARWESTLWGGTVVPADGERYSVETSPGLFGFVVSGYASRSWYAWLGGGYRRYADPRERPGDAAMGSLVVGYRPPAFRRDFPHPDWRVFVEVVLETTGHDVVDGRPVDGTGGEQVFVGPTVLGLYGSWGISGGPVFPVYQRWAGDQDEDLARFAVNVTFWW